MPAEDLILVTGAIGNTGSTLLQISRGAVLWFVRWFAPPRTRPDCRTHRPRLSWATSTIHDRSTPRWRESLTRIWSRHLVRLRRPAGAIRRTCGCSRCQASRETLPVRGGGGIPGSLSSLPRGRRTAIRELGIGFTFLRPNLYFQGLLAFQPMIAAQGHFVAPIGDARVSAIDVRDIAAVAAIALTEDGHDGKTYTITGPAAVTHTEMASALSKAIGQPVAFTDVPPDAFAGALKGRACRRGRSTALSRTTRITRAAKPKRSRRMSVRSPVSTRVTCADLPPTMRVPSSEPENAATDQCSTKPPTIEPSAISPS